MKAATERQRIVVFHETIDPDWRWISHHLPEVDWDFIRAPVATGSLRSRIGRLGAAFRVLKAAGDADLVVSIGGGLGSALELARIMVPTPMRHVCYYLNFDRLPTGVKRARQAQLYRKIDRFVVSSNIEKGQYATHFGIDPDRIDVVLWGVNPPVASAFRPSASDYICAVGGNARDYPMLMAVAADRPEIDFVVVARPVNLAALTIPSNVEVLCNIPNADAMAVITGARLMALPLVTTDTPCGHVTIIAAYYLGTPLVITGSTGVEDYVRGGETGLVTASGSAAEMGAAIDRLWSDSALAERLSAAAKAFAHANCTELNYPPHIRSLLAGSAPQR